LIVKAGALFIPAAVTMKKALYYNLKQTQM
jgi:hypothetical protein